MRSPEFMAGYARRCVDKALACTAKALTERDAWREYECTGAVLAFAMRCGLVGEAEGMRMLERMDAALEAGLKHCRSKKISPKGSEAVSRKIAA